MLGCLFFETSFHSISTSHQTDYNLLHQASHNKDVPRKTPPSIDTRVYHLSTTGVRKASEAEGSKGGSVAC